MCKLFTNYFFSSVFQILIHHRGAASWRDGPKIGYLNHIRAKSKKSGIFQYRCCRPWSLAHWRGSASNAHDPHQTPIKMSKMAQDARNKGPPSAGGWTAATGNLLTSLLLLNRILNSRVLESCEANSFISSVFWLGRFLCLLKKCEWRIFWKINSQPARCYPIFRITLQWAYPCTTLRCYMIYDVAMNINNM